MSDHPGLTAAKTERETLRWEMHKVAGLFVLRETECRDGPLAIAAWGLNGLEPHYRCHFDTCSNPDTHRHRSSQKTELAGTAFEDIFA